MKKILLGASALLMCLSAAEAAPIKLSVGGYSKLYTAYVDGNGSFNDAYNYNHVPVVGYIELAFKGVTETANGTKFGAVVEYEGLSTSDTDIKKAQSYIHMDTAYGRMMAGKFDTISKQFHTSAKDVGIIEIEASDVGMIVPGGMDYVATDVRQNGVDSTSVAYISPKFAGFTVAASYSDMGPNGTHNMEGNNAGYMGVLAYDHDFNGFKLSANVTYAHFDAAYPADDIISAGIRTEFSGFTVGGGYKHENSVIPVLGDTNTFDFGIAYEQGPRYGVSLSYINETREGIRNLRDATKQMVLGSASFGITPGVKASVSAAYINDKNHVHDYDAYMLATGLLVAF